MSTNSFERALSNSPSLICAFFVNFGRLTNIFCSQIVELTVHLVDDNTGRSEFPDAEGNFDFDGFPGGTQLVVRGEAKDASGFLSPPTSSRQPVYHSTPSLFSPSGHTSFSSTNPPTPPSAYGDSESSSSFS